MRGPLNRGHLKVPMKSPGPPKAWKVGGVPADAPAPGRLRCSGAALGKIGGSRLSNTTCLTQVFFKRGE